MKAMKLQLLILFIVLPASINCQNTSDNTENIVHSAESSADTISLENILLLRQIAVIRGDLSIEYQKISENLSLSDRNKAAGIISELLNRAEQKILGVLPTGRFPWSWTGFEKPSDIVKMARGFFDTLSLGEDPFAGKFAEPGGYVIDHAIIEKDGLFHLIYIRGVAATSWPDYPERNFGHAVSHDLKTWHIKEPVLQTIDSGFDSFQVWAPHIIRHEGKYWNFYTGVNDSVCQTICLATSDDLYNWERHEGNPVITSEPWGVWNESQWSDCRDPMVLKDGNIFYCYYTAARIVPETGKHEYCIGIVSPKDLITWKDEARRPFKHTVGTPPESPFVVKRNGEYYLFYTNYKYGIVYVKGSDPLNGWMENPDDPQSILEGVSASEIFEKDNKWYITFISHMNNGLHFFEVRELIWHKDGTVSVLEKMMK